MRKLFSSLFLKTNFLYFIFETKNEKTSEILSKGLLIQLNILEIVLKITLMFCLSCKNNAIITNSNIILIIKIQTYFSLSS